MGAEAHCHACGAGLPTKEKKRAQTNDMVWGICAALAVAFYTAFGIVLFQGQTISRAPSTIQYLMMYVPLGALAILNLGLLGLTARGETISLHSFFCAGAVLGVASFAAYGIFINIPFWTRQEAALLPLLAIISIGPFWIMSNWIAAAVFRRRFAAARFVPVFVSVWLIGTVSLWHTGSTLFF